MCYYTYVHGSTLLGDFLAGARGGDVDQSARMNDFGDAAVVLLKSKCRGRGA